MKLIPADNTHLQAIYGDDAPTFSMQVWAAVEDGETFGVGGLYYDRGRKVFFMRVKEELRSKPLFLVKSARFILSHAHGRCFALCDRSIEQAERFLDFLGFDNVEGELWQIQLA